MLDADLLSLIRASIRSIWALELLMLLKRRAPSAVTVGGLVQDLRATHTLIERCLGELEAGGLIARDSAGAASFAPAAPDLADLCQRLEAAYRDRPVAVRDAIANRGDDSLRNFADAFRLKGDPKKPDPKKEGDT